MAFKIILPEGCCLQKYSTVHSKHCKSIFTNSPSNVVNTLRKFFVSYDRIGHMQCTLGINCYINNPLNQNSKINIDIYHANCISPQLSLLAKVYNNLKRQNKITYIYLFIFYTLIYLLSLRYSFFGYNNALNIKNLQLILTIFLMHYICNLSNTCELSAYLWKTSSNDFISKQTFNYDIILIQKTFL